MEEQSVDKQGNVLLMLSGGLDSTTALVKLLRETNYALHVHFIYYMNVEGRYDAETQAVKKIVPYCRAKFRKFGFTTTTQDYRAIGVPCDMFVTRFTAAQVCRNIRPFIDKICTGSCLDDYADPNYEIKKLHTDALFVAAMQGVNRPCPNWFYPVSEMSKVDELNYLASHAPELIEMTHSCRKPILMNDVWTDCLQCVTCFEMAIAKKAFNETRAV
jgi:7-cyano-7-deazaguanine synthase in queuosine biosynthesis